jgi:hypothetical protein
MYTLSKVASAKAPLIMNYAKILVENHTTMASELFTYMSIIRGALADATFDRVYMYDQQFRLRKSLNPTCPWSQVDGMLVSY